MCLMQQDLRIWLPVAKGLQTNKGGNRPTLCCFAHQKWAWSLDRSVTCHLVLLADHNARGMFWMMGSHLTFLLIFDVGLGFFPSNFLGVLGTSALSTWAKCTYISISASTGPAWNFPFCYKVCICQKQLISVRACMPAFLGRILQCLPGISSENRPISFHNCL